MCFNKCPLAKDKELFEAIDARQQSIDILRPHDNVGIITLPYERIPRELAKLCDSSVTKLYSKNGRLQHIDVSTFMSLDCFYSLRTQEYYLLLLIANR